MAVSKAKKGLGRGLSALIPDDDMDFLSRIARGDVGAISSNEGRRTNILKPRQNAVGTVQAETRFTTDSPIDPVQSPQAQVIPVAAIEANPFQPRRHFAPEEMSDLIESIREHGILQPILVRPVPEGSATGTTVKFQLVAGERRWRAAQEAGLDHVPAVVRNVGDQQALELAVIENVQRHDISPLEAALAYQRLSADFSLSQENIARRVGKSRSAIANTMRLLDLPEEIQKALEDGALSEGHGRAILLASGEGSRRAVFRRILRDKLSVRDAERIARAASDADESKAENKDGPAVRGRDTVHSSEAISRIQESLQKALGTRVKLQARAKGGRLQIEYYSNEDLSRIIELLLRSKP